MRQTKQVKQVTPPNAHGRYLVPVTQWAKIEALVKSLMKAGIPFECTDVPNATYEVWYTHDTNKTQLPPARTHHTCDCTLITFGKYIQTDSVENVA